MMQQDHADIQAALATMIVDRLPNCGFILLTVDILGNFNIQMASNIANEEFARGLLQEASEHYTLYDAKTTPL